MKKFPYKKIPYYATLASLTVGASLILGFLSFGGMYVLLPVLPLAIATFVLSVAYEGEIYLQNIKGTLNKLFKRDYLKNHLAKQFLLEYFPDIKEHKFFADYAEQLQRLDKFEHKRLDKESKQQKKRIEKALADMEQWFAQQLFNPEHSAHTPSSYTPDLRTWFAKQEQRALQQKYQNRLKKRTSQFNAAKVFSLLAGLFMGIGSTYLIVEAFTIIPFMAAISFTFWPILIVPMALIAGIAYGMLTYNAITDLINNNTIKKWFGIIRDDIKNKQFFRPLIAVFLFAIALLLTLCTAGTWWTIAKNAQPLFLWMKKIPDFVMGIINPAITGVSALAFNTQNIAESLEMVSEAAEHKTNPFTRFLNAIKERFKDLRTHEHWLQMLNPFRLLLKLTVTPLRILLFLGHLVSIAMTSDRMPGVPQILSVLVAMISEGFEDAHYFIGGDHDKSSNPKDIKSLLNAHLGEASDDHGTDIPTRILKFLASPLYALAALWDHLTSKINPPNDTNRKPLTFAQAWNKQRGVHEKEHVILETTPPSPEWQAEHAVFLIEQHEEKCLKNARIGSKAADKKRTELAQLKQQVREKAAHKEPIKDVLLQAANNPAYKHHRLFHANKDSKTATQEFIETLNARVNPC